MHGKCSLVLARGVIYGTKKDAKQAVHVVKKNTHQENDDQKTTNNCPQD